MLSQVDEKLTDETAEAELEWLKSIIVSIPSIRSEMNVSPAKQVSILLRKGTAVDKSNLEHLQALLKTLAKVDSIQWLNNNDTPPPASSAFVGELEIIIPLAGLINLDDRNDAR